MTEDRRPTTVLMGTRRKSRELCLQMLFQADMGRQGPDAVRKTFWAERKEVGEDVRGFADDLFRTATDRTIDIDKLIEGHAEHWRMERMAAVDRNILRSAVAEFLGYPQTPRAVVINEAIETPGNFPARSRCSSSTACLIAWAGSGKSADLSRLRNPLRMRFLPQGELRPWSAQILRCARMTKQRSG